MSPLDVRIGRFREAATSDPVLGNAIDLVGMQPGDLLLELLGYAKSHSWAIVPAADRAALADAIAPMGAAPPADLPDALRCAAHGVALCVEPGCSPGPGGGR